MEEIKTTRSIKVGLLLKDKESMKRLIDSHDFFGYCVEYYTELLLEMRGEDVYLRDPISGEEELKNASVYQEALCKRIKEAASRNGNKNELTPEEIEDFKSWCQKYYDETIESSNPKGRVNILQNSEIKEETSSGRSSRLVCQTRELLKSNPNILRDLNAPDSIVVAGENINKSKSNAEAIAEWIFDNKTLALECCKSEINRINTICEEFPKEQKKKIDARNKKGNITSAYGQKGIKVLPLVEKPVVSFIEGVDSEIRNISSWYYGAWTIAVQRLKSWNTWNQNSYENYQKTKALLSEKESELEKLPKESKDFIINVLKKYEEKKDKEIRQNDIDGSYSGHYYILGRELRGIDSILEKLLKEESFEKRINLLNKLQDENNSEIGDINLFRFIAEDENFKYVIDAKSCVEAAKVYKQVNKIKTKLEQIKDHAAFTMCNQNYSPAWTQFEIGGGAGSNYPGYSLDSNLETISMALVNETERNISITTKNLFVIAHSEQLKSLVMKDGKYNYIDPGTRRVFSDVKIGGAKLQFDRDLLSKNIEWRNKDKIKVYFNISLEIKDKINIFPNSLYQMNVDNEVKGLFFSGDEKKKIFLSTGKVNNDITLLNQINQKPFTVMAVDLGLRATFSYSIFSINNDNNKSSSFEIRDFLTNDKIKAVHIRSGQIRLLGDKPTHLVEEKRRLLDDAANTIRYKIDAIRYFRRLSSCKANNRKESILKLLNRYKDSPKGWPYKGLYTYKYLIDLTGKFINQQDDKWIEFIDSTALIMKKDLSKEFKRWSDEVRKPRIYEDSEREQIIGLAGKSLWNISYLSKVYNIMKKWHTLAEKSNERSGLNKGEVFAHALNNKINNLKELRQKETSDSLIMTALGYVWVAGKSENRLIKVLKDNLVCFITEEEYLNNRDNYTLFATGKDKYKAKNGFWIKLYDSCDAIIFEELQNYRTDDEKPTHENSMLMSWSHRSTVNQVRMQGELFGLKIGSVGASYSSRFHAMSGCPGIRANVYGVKKLYESYSELLRFLLIPEEERRKGSLSHLSRILLDMCGNDAPEKVGNIISIIEKRENYNSFGVLLPDKGGEYFLYGKKEANGSIKLCYVNADINAAQNLAKRWLTRYDNPQKINVKIIDSNILPVCDNSVRINRILGPSCVKVEGNTPEKWFSGILSPIADKKKDLETINDKEEDDDEELGICSLLKDYSNTFFDSGRWYSSLQFWKTVNSEITNLAFNQPIIVSI